MSPQNKSTSSLYLLELLKCFYCSTILPSKDRLKFGKVKKRGVKTDKIFDKVGYKVIIHQNNKFFQFVHLFQITLSLLEIRDPKYPHLNNPKTNLILGQLYIYVVFHHFLKKCLHSLWSRDYDYKQTQHFRLKTHENRKFPDQVSFI